MPPAHECPQWRQTKSDNISDRIMTATAKLKQKNEQAHQQQQQKNSPPLEVKKKKKRSRPSKQDPRIHHLAIK